MNFDAGCTSNMGDVGSRIGCSMPLHLPLNIRKSMISKSLELPKKYEMTAFLDRTVAELGGGDE